MNKQIKIHPDQENRSFPIEYRAEGESRTVEGYAATTGVVYDMGDFDEVIAPGAFDETDFSDVCALFNHNPSDVLARSNASVDTLDLNVDLRGLRYKFDAPNTTAGNDVVENLRLKNIIASSFAFVVAKHEWTRAESGRPLRTLEKIKVVYDVGPVTYPGNPDTDVALRSMGNIDETQQFPPDDDGDEPEEKRGFSDEVLKDIIFHNGCNS